MSFSFFQRKESDHLQKTTSLDSQQHILQTSRILRLP